MNLTSMIGGQCWFSVDSKSFDLSVEEVDGRLKGVVVEQGRGFSTCIRFKELSLRYSLEGVGFSVETKSCGDGVKFGRREGGSSSWSVIQMAKGGSSLPLLHCCSDRG